MPAPITVAIERAVDPSQEHSARRWVQQGIDLATRRDGFLGSGWVQATQGSDRWYMLYRFSDERLLDDWEQSDERAQWISAGSRFAVQTGVERRSGIEGWFDAADAKLLSPESAPPPRWKQAVVILIGFYPMNLLANLLLGLVPGFAGLPLPIRLLVSTALLTPAMVFGVLPFVTHLLRRWLHGPQS